MNLHVAMVESGDGGDGGGRDGGGDGDGGTGGGHGGGGEATRGPLHRTGAPVAASLQSTWGVEREFCSRRCECEWDVGKQLAPRDPG